MVSQNTKVLSFDEMAEVLDGQINGTLSHML